MPLAAALAGLVSRPVDATEQARTALHLLDWAACATAGLREPGAGPFTRVAMREAAGPCLALGAGRRMVETAILANAPPSNLLELDDIHRASMLHPGPVVVPAALAVAESVGAEAPALLDAIVVGYEVMVRLGRASGPAHYRMFHPTATCGPAGAAVAAARLLGLDADRTAHAIRLAMAQASGPWQTLQSANEAKQLHVAHAARAGWLAARLAEQGAAGALGALEGTQGFFASMCPDARPDAVLGAWSLDEVGFKPWPACRHTHAAIDAALVLRGQLPAQGSIRLRTYATAVAMCDRGRPTTPAEARFSLQHAVAVTLLDGPPDLASFGLDAIARPDVAALRDRVRVCVDEVWGHETPPRFRAALSAADAHVEIEDALGDPANPLPTHALLTKATMLLGHGGVTNPQATIDAALALTRGGTLHDLTSTLEMDAPP